MEGFSLLREACGEDAAQLVLLLCGQTGLWVDKTNAKLSYDNDDPSGFSPAAANSPRKVQQGSF
jgi:hypothetical protein